MILALSSPGLKAETVDLIIAADHIVTMDEDNTVFKDAAIAVDNGIIVAIDDKASIDKLYTAKRHFQGRCGNM